MTEQRNDVGRMRPLRPGGFALGVMMGCLAWLMSAGQAQSEPSGAPTFNLQLEVFIRGDNPLCLRAVEYAREFTSARGGIEVVVHDVQQDQKSLAQFYKLTNRLGVEKPSLPAFYTFDRLHIGFTDAATTGPKVEALFDIEAFVREGCSHCQDAKAFLSELTKRWPGIRVRHYDVIQDAAAHRRMDDLARRAKKNVTGLPVLYVCGYVIVGYDSDATTGRTIEDLLSKGVAAEKTAPPNDTPTSQAKPLGPRFFPRAPGLDASLWPNSSWLPGVLNTCLLAVDEPSSAVEKEPLPADTGPGPLKIPEVGEETPTTYGPVEEPPPRSAIKVPGFDYYLDAEELGMPVFTFIVGLLDGFNPCAMWVLVFLLSVLVNIRSRVRIIAIAGTFVLISGLAYFTFMAAWLNVFLLVGFSRPIQIVLGLLGAFMGVVNVKDFLAFKKGWSFSIPESAKPGIYTRVRQIVLAKSLMVAVGLSIVLAIGVNVIELACTAGLPAMYTEILTLQKLPAWENYAYLLLYNLAYMLDDSILLTVFVITLSHRKLQEGEGRWLKLISGLVMLALSLVLLFKPEWLHG